MPSALSLAPYTLYILAKLFDSDLALPPAHRAYGPVGGPGFSRLNKGPLTVFS